MHYENMVPGIFLERPNRFVAHVEIQGKTHIVHVKNTGRCRELLPSGAKVWCQKSGNPARKTAYDLISVQKGSRIINMDSQAPNAAAKEWLLGGGLGEISNLRAETTYRQSRFDFSFDRNGKRCFLEVKGVTLENQGVCAFPDAPTLRGSKHLQELICAAQSGFEAYVLFVIQMDNVRYLQPNWETDPAFSARLRDAASAGVNLLAMDCAVTPDSMVIGKPVEIRLTPSSDNLIG